MKIKLFEAFAGYGSQRLALRNIGADFESVGISEIDKYALQAYEKIHGDCPNFGDISKINWSEVPDFDLFTYSFACTDISVAGAQKGFKKDSGTRSSLLWECERAIKEKRPKILLMENVKALVSKKFIGDFHAWQEVITGYGYTNFTAVLNSNDYGVAQDRERVFMVSFLSDTWFSFPPKVKLEKFFIDYLEDNVSEKYTLTEKALNYMERDYCGKSRMVRYSIRNVLKDKCSNTIVSNFHKRIPNNVMTDNNNNVRNFTPRECFRLMGVSDMDFEKLHGISDTQLYKLAGNSIVVPVLEGIFKEILKTKI